jgi:two-component sensor histidine kinase
MLAGRTQDKPGEDKPLLVQLAESKPDSTRIDILVQLANYYFYKISLLNRMDSVVFYLKETQQLNEAFHFTTLQNRINILNAKYAWKLNPDQDAKNVFIPVIDICKNTGDKPNEGQAWVELAARLGRAQESTDFKIICYQNAIESARQMHDNYSEMTLLRYIADIHLQQGKLDLATKELFDLLKEKEKAGSSNVMQTYDLLAAVYITKGVYDSALMYALKTIKTMEATGDSTFAVTFYSRLHGIYANIGKPSQSKEWEKKLTNNILRNYDVTSPFEPITATAAVLVNEGKAREALKLILHEVSKKKPETINDQRLIQRALGSCYDALQKYDLAENCYIEMIRLGNEQKNIALNFSKAMDHYEIGVFYFKRGNYKKARSFLETAIENGGKNGSLQNFKDFHLYLFRVDSALGNYTGAIKHLRQSNQITDSIFSVTRNKQIEELQIVYETEEKDKNFKVLEGKEKLVQVKLQHAESTRNWIIAGASMLLIIAGLLYRQTLMRKKNNRIIENKNDQLQHLVTENEWLLKEVHHRVKNNLHTVIGLLESQAAYLQDDALKANEISKHRVYAMSLIHQQLYKAEDIKTIDMSVYLPELLDYLTESFDTGRKIRFRRDIEPLKLGVSQAIPIALIVNEAVTNSIKYAFIAGKQGMITVSMHEKDGKINLVISDDGIGIDPVLINTVSTSMGLKLMKGLTEDIEGDIHFIHDNGTRIMISFYPDSPNDYKTLSKNN